jgi:transglutaminase-like putative cysteine protease
MSTPPDLGGALQSAGAVDADHPGVIAYARRHVAGIEDPRAQAIALHLAVRDDFRYDPYTLDLSPEGFRASTVLERGFGYCIPKAALLAATCRAVGIPARLGFADVRNHLTSPRLAERMGGDVFLFHGYTELWLEDRWVKATPAFNRSLCEKTGTLPLEFDGRQDSILHPLDGEGRRHMEYLVEHGSFDDVPMQRILDTWRAAYAFMGDAGMAADAGGAEGFEREAGGAGA